MSDGACGAYGRVQNTPQPFSVQAMIPRNASPANGARLVPVAIFVAAVSLAGCARQVAVDGSYNPGAARNGSFANLLVVGVSPDTNQRCAFEQALAANLRSDTVKATMSCSVMSTGEPLTREGVEKAIGALGADAVLATSLVVSTAKVKEGGSADARGGGYYKATDIGYDYGYWGAYGVPVVYGEFETAPSVFSISGTVELVTRVFETGNATLIYTLTTKAKDLPSRSMALAEITPEIAERLQREGLLR